MSALTLKDLTLATPPKIVPDFVDELVQPERPTRPNSIN